MALAVSFGLQAQDSTEQNATGKLEVISVTAQKRVENAQEVPITMSVVNMEKVNAYSVSGDDIKFLTARVPSLVAESSMGRSFPRFYIRGFGNTDFSFNASQPVELVYDDVIQSSPNMKGFPIFDVERIEVLKGPQGTLFGRNTPAGVVKIDTKKPTEDLDGYISASFGRFGQTNVQGAVGGTLIDGTLTGRVSGITQNRSDYVDNEFTSEKDALGGYHDNAARVQLNWTPSDDISVLFNYHHRDLNGTSTIFYANAIDAGTKGFGKGFDRYSVNQDGHNASRMKQDGGSVRATFELGDYTLTSISAYEDMTFYSLGDVDGGCASCDPAAAPFFSVETAGGNAAKQYSQELRLASNFSDAFNYQTGLFYFYEDATNNDFGYNTEAGGTLNSLNFQRQGNHTFGAFVSASYDLTDVWSVTGGARWTNDTKRFSSVQVLANGGQPVVNPNSAYAETDESEISWDISTNYTLDKGVMVYGRIAKGFRAPSIAGTPDYTTAVDAETLISVEAGVKSTLLDGDARLNVAVFRYEVDGQQLTAVGGEDNNTRLLNADTTVGQGIEAEFEIALTPDFIVTAAGSYNDTEIQDADLGVAPCGSGCTVLDPINANGFALIDGNRLPQAPEWIGSLTARYTVPMESGDLYFFTDWAYKSETNLFLYNSTEFTAEESLEGGLRIGYQTHEGYEVALWSRNITDEETVTGAIDFNNFTGIANQPRTFGIEFKASFY
ncbi:TonB-dependent receptor [Alteromonas lipolytica]|nr:TonB-dependent receptor [Alteromonas lipolytica]